MFGVLGEFFLVRCFQLEVDLLGSFVNLAGGEHIRLVLVDDDGDIEQLLIAVLATQAGHELEATELLTVLLADLIKRDGDIRAGWRLQHLIIVTEYDGGVLAEVAFIDNVLVATAVELLLFGVVDDFALLIAALLSELLHHLLMFFEPGLFGQLLRIGVDVFFFICQNVLRFANALGRSGLVTTMVRHRLLQRLHLRARKDLAELEGVWHVQRTVTVFCLFLGGLSYLHL